MCSIGADIVLESWNTIRILLGHSLDQQDHVPIHAKIKTTVLCDVYFKLTCGSPRCTSFDDFEDVIAQLNNGIHRQHTKRKDSNTAHCMNDNILRVRQVEAKFCATYYVARTAKQLLTSEGSVLPRFSKGQGAI